jgi:aminopeptidase N
MSDKIVTPDFPTVNHGLRFLLSRYPAAYAVDRTRGTNPVIQELGNMKDAGSLYGAIIYNKAPIVMRQLEQLAGEEKLRVALQIYLKEYSFDNARWNDLIAIIEKVTRKPLEEWSRMWVREAGMPLLTPVVRREDAEMKEAVTDPAVAEQPVKKQSYRISFREDDPAGMLRHWPQTLQTMVITEKDTVTGEVTPADKRSFLTASAIPLCIIPDITGRAYGTFLLDSTTVSYLPDHINDFQDPLLRGILWINMHENLLNGTVSPTVYYNALFTALQTEEELQLRNYLAGRLGYVYWHRLSDSARTANAPDAESMIWQKLITAETASEKRQWFGLFRNVAVTERGLARLRDLWKSGQLPGGAVAYRPESGPVRLGEDEQSGLALTLALRNHPEAMSIIAAQRARITTADRLQRFDFVLPSVSPDQAVRDEFFNSLRDLASREHEPWVLEALGYLHHPSVAHRSEHYILPSLELLEEIKRTGDIFFPGGWISTTLSGHHSASARETVERFLEERPDYPSDLRLKILQAADHLFRQ